MSEEHAKFRQFVRDVQALFGEARRAYQIASAFDWPELAAQVAKIPHIDAQAMVWAVRPTLNDIRRILGLLPDWV